jgi:hypothetical protein
LDVKDIDAIDAALARLQALPLTEETRMAISELADFILTMEFKKAEDVIKGLMDGQENLP